MIVLLAGSSGLVGSHTLPELLNNKSISKIILIVRSKQAVSDPRIIQVVTSFDQLSSVDLSSFGVDHIDAAICALGSTIKMAGSKSEFKKIDCFYVLAFAELAKKFGAKKFSVISALGANAASPVFYNKVKGEMEEGLSKLHFDTLTIIRPSLLLGERRESDKRLAEKFFIKLSPILNQTLVGPLKKYRGIEAKKVASHLANSLKSEERGLVFIENEQMISI
jgi:uncharacterized protein YbjT (DUF2867 family)